LQSPPTTPTQGVTVHGTNVNVLTGQGTINDNKIDNSTKETNVEIKPEAKKDKIDWVKILIAVLTIAGAAAGLGVKLGWF